MSFDSYVSRELRQRVDSFFMFAPVESVLPVVDEPLDVCQRDAVVPTRAIDFVREAHEVELLLQQLVDLGRVALALGRLHALAHQGVEGLLLAGAELLHRLGVGGQHLVDDGILAIIAGADTTSIALTSITYCLLTHPDVYERLQAEIDKFYPAGENALSPKHHRDMPYLTAVM